MRALKLMLTAAISPFPLVSLALPLESRDPPRGFNITSLMATLPYIGVYGSGPVDSFLTITVSYPHLPPPPPPNTNDAPSETKCTFNWPKGTAPHAFEWSPCDDPTLQWRLPADGWTYQTDYVVELFLPTTTDG